MRTRWIWITAMLVVLAAGNNANAQDPMEVQRCVWRCLAGSSGPESPAYHACVARNCSEEAAPSEAVAGAPPSQVDGRCTNGMQWIGGWAGAALIDAVAHATYRNCEGLTRTPVRLGCDHDTGGFVLSLSDAAAPGTGTASIELEITVDGMSTRLVGHNEETGGLVRPTFGFARDSGLLQQLKGGQRAEFRVGDYALDAHLTGSSRAIDAMTTACIAQAQEREDDLP